MRSTRFYNSAVRSDSDHDDIAAKRRYGKYLWTAGTERNRRDSAVYLGGDLRIPACGIDVDNSRRDLRNAFSVGRIQLHRSSHRQLDNPAESHATIYGQHFDAVVFNHPKFTERRCWNSVSGSSNHGVRWNTAVRLCGH